TRMLGSALPYCYQRCAHAQALSVASMRARPQERVPASRFFHPSVWLPPCPHRLVSRLPLGTKARTPRLTRQRPPGWGQHQPQRHVSLRISIERTLREPPCLQPPKGFAHRDARSLVAGSQSHFGKQGPRGRAPLPDLEPLPVLGAKAPAHRQHLIGVAIRMLAIITVRMGVMEDRQGEDELLQVTECRARHGQYS